MNKTELQALLQANGVDFKSTDTVPTLRQLALDHNLPLTSNTPVDTGVVVNLRPAPSPAVVNGANLTIVAEEMSNVKLMYGFDPNQAVGPDNVGRAFTLESAKKKHPQGFNGYLYKKGALEIPFTAYCSSDAKFIRDFANEDIHSLNLTANVTGVQLPATQYDAPRPEVFYELNTIITKKNRAYLRKDKFEDFVFNPDNFVSNPELLSKSGMLEEILNKSV